MSLRFAAEPAALLREAIRESGGIELFAIGDVLGRDVIELAIHCRGDEGSVPALLRRPRAGQVVIHNHPSGDLRPSEADLELAGLYGDEGVGVVIVDNAVSRDRWVVEPARREERYIDREVLRGFFEHDLPAALPGCEIREGQIQMAEAAADALEGGRILLAEAGTGTGKSLAYLIPSILWALENDGRVVISTHTIHLQEQILLKDLPLARKAGLAFRASLVKGRGNYICRRKLASAAADSGSDGEMLARIQEWIEDGAAAEGSRQEFGESIDGEAWEHIASDAHHTLRARCPHYNDCFYYEARRRAATSHVLIVNHALLLADLSIKAQGGQGVLPRYDRVVLDEGHHLEDAATGAGSTRLTQRAIDRAISPLLDSRRRPGALTRLLRGRHGDQLERRVSDVEVAVSRLRSDMDRRFRELRVAGLGQSTQRRITPAEQRSQRWEAEIAPPVEGLIAAIEAAGQAIGALAEAVDPFSMPVAEVQPWMDLGRARSRLEEHADRARRFLGQDPGTCRWLEVDPKNPMFDLRICTAPVEVGELLRAILYDRIYSLVVTSATMAVGDRFDHFMERCGLAPEIAETAVFPSPFDYPRQALLGLPRDLPPPEQPGYVDAVGLSLADMLWVSRGGAFVLCTSHEQVRGIAAQLRYLRPRLQIFAQGEAPRRKLLASYLEARDGVLIGTDSFWEGVSVAGDALRLVAIPRLPFRVPTEPVAQARYERLEALGKDPFRAESLPRAIIKLRQGFGRLIRTRSDRGAVVILDRRVIDRWYGRVFLNALPKAARVTGPTRRVVERLQLLYDDEGRYGDGDP